MPLLEINNLCASVDGQEILRGVDLVLEEGAVHAIMGPNGSGKSTLSHVLAGRDDYEVTDGTVRLDGTDLFAMDPEERALAGVFLGFQYPVELPGVVGTTFLRTAVNAHRTHRGEDALDAMQFVRFVREKSAALQIEDDMLKRPVNVGFSGGEKKRNEILQLALLEPRLAILDETDSGLDIDALRLVSEGINAMRDPARGFLIITHYQRLLDYVEPDHIHILIDGRIVRSGDMSLAPELEREGYARYAGVAA